MLTELFRPPPHRGPLIAAGAVPLVIGLLLVEFRLDDKLGSGVHLLIAAAAGALLYAIGLQFRTEGGQPLASASVLLVAALTLAAVALLRLAQVFGVDLGDLPSGTLVWTTAIFGGLALWPAVQRNSGACALLAALALTLFVPSAWDWIFDPSSVTPFRWLFLLLSLGFVFAALATRIGRPRTATVLVDAAGVSILLIALIALVESLLGLYVGGLFGADAARVAPHLPRFWELVVLAGALGSLAVGAVDREPGPVLLGIALSAAFVAVTGTGETLTWWPLLLLLGGGLMLGAGLRPRKPLPPPPGESAVPLASRAVPDEGPVRRVRHLD